MRWFVLKEIAFVYSTKVPICMYPAAQKQAVANLF